MSIVFVISKIIDWWKQKIYSILKLEKDIPIQRYCPHKPKHRLSEESTNTDNEIVNTTHHIQGLKSKEKLTTS